MGAQMPRNLKSISRSDTAYLALRVAGALLLLFVGADHFYEYSVDDYSVLPTIGTLFLLNFISATAVGVTLLVPLGRLLPRRHGVVVELAAVSGCAIAASSLVALLVSEQTKLFGFMESNYRPAIVVALASEVAAAVALAVLFGTTLARRRGRAGSRPRRRLRVSRA